MNKQIKTISCPFLPPHLVIPRAECFNHASSSLPVIQNPFPARPPRHESSRVEVIKTVRFTLLSEHGAGANVSTRSAENWKNCVPRDLVISMQINYGRKVFLFLFLSAGAGGLFENLNSPQSILSPDVPDDVVKFLEHFVNAIYFCNILGLPSNWEVAVRYTVYTFDANE